MDKENSETNDIKDDFHWFSNESIISVVSCGSDYNFSAYPSDIFIYNDREYKRRQLLARGAFAFCFLYESEGKELAVAKITTDTKDTFNKSLRNDVLKKQWKNEVHFMQKFDHSNIVKFFAFGEFSTLKYILMEYLPKNLMEEYLREPTMLISKVRQIMRGVFCALEYLHAQNIMHRDVKMSNTLLTSDNEAKLCDFGLTRQLNNDNEFTGSIGVCGTTNYLAPESITHAEYLTVKSDIWSAAVIMYAVLFGEMPFVDQSRIGQRFRIVNCIFDIPQQKQILEEYQPAIELLRKILVTDPRQRLSASMILSDVFFDNRNVQRKIDILDAPEKSDSKIERILLDEFLRIQRENNDTADCKRKYIALTDYDPGENIWLIGHLPAARNLGLAFALSDGKIGILFKDGATVHMMHNETNSENIAYEHRGKRKLSYDKERYKRVIALKFLRNDILKRTCLSRFRSMENEAIIRGYFRTRNVVIVLFVNSTYPINVQYKCHGKYFEFLIGPEYIHLFFKNDYRTYRRNNLPKLLISIIEKLVDIMSK